jgi:hypothetical protein
MYSLKKIINLLIEMFPIIFQSSMGLGKSRCDVPSGPLKDAFAHHALNSMRCLHL